MTAPIFDNPHKARRGLGRIWHAGIHSCHGLQAGWSEKGFPARGHTGVHPAPAGLLDRAQLVEAALLCSSVVLVLITELLNSAVEAAIDRIGPEWHALSKRAKDMGSAAVLLSLIYCAAVWAAALFQRFYG